MTSEPTRRSLQSLSLGCTLAMMLGLAAFALAIVLAKPALSAPVFGDVSGYVLLILVLAAAIWGLTWFYMARLSAADPAGEV